MLNIGTQQDFQTLRLLARTCVASAGAKNLVIYRIIWHKWFKLGSTGQFKAQI